MQCVRPASSDKGPISAGGIHCFQLSLKNLSIHINLLYNVSNYWLIHRELLCFHYYCRTCWESRHQNLRSHKPLMRSYYRYQNISSITHIVALTRTQRPQIIWVDSNSWFSRRLNNFAQIHRVLLRFCSDICPDLTRLWNLCEYIENDFHQEHQKWRRPCNQTHSISLSTPQSSSNSKTGITLRGGTIDRCLPKQHNEIDKLINPNIHFWMSKVRHVFHLVTP